MALIALGSSINNIYIEGISNTIRTPKHTNLIIIPSFRMAPFRDIFRDTCNSELGTA